jgi:hypothetical protein
MYIRKSIGFFTFKSYKEMNIWNRVTKGMQPADFTLPNADGNKMLLEYVDGIIMDLLTSNQTIKPKKISFQF